MQIEVDGIRHIHIEDVAWIEGERDGVDDRRGRLKASTALTGCLRALPVIALGTSLFVAGADPALALPEGGNVVAGDATIEQIGADTLNITHGAGSPNVAIEWQSFGVASGEVVNFHHHSIDSATLNTVIGNLASQIDGTINTVLIGTAGGATGGTFVLVNPNGINFGAGSNVNVGSIVASTIGIENGDFMAGEFKFGVAGNPNARVINEGTITVADAGVVAFMAPGGVKHTGVINAKLGRVSMAAGNKMTLDFYGDGLIQIAVDDAGVAARADGEALIEQQGEIYADGGVVQLTAAAAKGVVDNVINMTGVIQARTVSQTASGEIILDGGEHGTVNVAGILDAGGRGEGTKGGKVSIVGETVQLAATANIDVSGKAGGGSAFIGINGPKLKPDVPPPADYAEATTTVVEEGSTIDADATDQGDGGDVLVWSADSTIYAGDITARGGAYGGDGGFIEVSGRKLAFRGTADTTAIHGATGWLLLDPNQVNVSINADAGGDPQTVNDGTLNTALGLNNVIVSALIKIVIEAGTAVDTGVNILFLGAPTVDLGATIAGTVAGGSGAPAVMPDPVGLPTNPVDPTTVNVLNDTASIQQAVDIAADGGTVNVAAGTYDGYVMIGKPLKIFGGVPFDTDGNPTGPGNSDIDPTDGNVSARLPESVITGDPWDNLFSITQTQGETEIKGFFFSGGKTGIYSTFGSPFNFSIQNNIFDGQKYAGIDVNGGFNSVGRILNNVVRFIGAYSDYNAYGIKAYATDLEVNFNDILNVYSSGGNAFGIYARSGIEPVPEPEAEERLVVDNNEIDYIISSASPYIGNGDGMYSFTGLAAGIVAKGANTIDVTNNTLNGNPLMSVETVSGFDENIIAGNLAGIGIAILGTSHDNNNSNNNAVEPALVATLTQYNDCDCDGYLPYTSAVVTSSGNVMKNIFSPFYLFGRQAIGAGVESVELTNGISSISGIAIGEIALGSKVLLENETITDVFGSFLSFGGIAIATGYAPKTEMVTETTFETEEYGGGSGKKKHGFYLDKEFEEELISAWPSIFDFLSGGGDKEMVHESYAVIKDSTVERVGELEIEEYMGPPTTLRSHASFGLIGAGPSVTIWGNDVTDIDATALSVGIIGVDFFSIHKILDYALNPMAMMQPDGIAPVNAEEENEYGGGYRKKGGYVFIDENTVTNVTAGFDGITSTVASVQGVGGDYNIAAAFGIVGLGKYLTVHKNTVTDITATALGFDNFATECTSCDGSPGLAIAGGITAISLAGKHGGKGKGKNKAQSVSEETTFEQDEYGGPDPFEIFTHPYLLVSQNIVDNVTATSEFDSHMGSEQVTAGFSLPPISGEAAWGFFTYGKTQAVVSNTATDVSGGGVSTDVVGLLLGLDEEDGPLLDGDGFFAIGARGNGSGSGSVYDWYVEGGDKNGMKGKSQFVKSWLLFDDNTALNNSGDGAMARNFDFAKFALNNLGGIFGNAGSVDSPVSDETTGNGSPDGDSDGEPVGDGLNIKDIYTVKVFNNHLNFNANNGLAFAGGTYYADVRENYITGNGDNGIDIENSNIIKSKVFIEFPDSMEPPSMDDFSSLEEMYEYGGVIVDVKSSFKINVNYLAGNGTDPDEDGGAIDNEAEVVFDYDSTFGIEEVMGLYGEDYMDGLIKKRGYGIIDARQNFYGPTEESDVAALLDSPLFPGTSASLLYSSMSCEGCDSIGNIWFVPFLTNSFDINTRAGGDAPEIPGTGKEPFGFQPGTPTVVEALAAFLFPQFDNELDEGRRLVDDTNPARGLDTRDSATIAPWPGTTLAVFNQTYDLAELAAVSPAAGIDPAAFWADLVALFGQPATNLFNAIGALSPANQAFLTAVLSAVTTPELVATFLYPATSGGPSQSGGVMGTGGTTSGPVQVAAEPEQTDPAPLSAADRAKLQELVPILGEANVEMLRDALSSDAALATKAPAAGPGAAGGLPALAPAAGPGAAGGQRSPLTGCDQSANPWCEFQ